MPIPKESPESQAEKILTQVEKILTIAAQARENPPQSGDELLRKMGLTSQELDGVKENMTLGDGINKRAFQRLGLGDSSIYFMAIADASLALRLIDVARTKPTSVNPTLLSPPSADSGRGREDEASPYNPTRAQGAHNRQARGYSQ